tara:strand:- start:928 stop:1416 length:489 start_codon:yes stop_codon:yes gene_type:complete
MANNKWKQPNAPPPPLFLNKKERDLVKQVNDELTERVIGQQILYYAIDVVQSDFHPLYGEAVEKTFLPPVRVFVLIDWEGLKTTTDKYGLDVMTTVTVHFHKRRLTEDQDIFVREGDFILYGSLYYEIVTLNEPTQLFGQNEHKLEISAKCVRARKGLFDAR